LQYPFLFAEYTLQTEIFSHSKAALVSWKPRDTPVIFQLLQSPDFLLLKIIIRSTSSVFHLCVPNGWAGFVPPHKLTN